MFEHLLIPIGAQINTYDNQHMAYISLSVTVLFIVEVDTGPLLVYHQTEWSILYVLCVKGMLRI